MNRPEAGFEDRCDSTIPLAMVDAVVVVRMLLSRFYCKDAWLLGSVSEREMKADAVPVAASGWHVWGLGGARDSRFPAGMTNRKEGTKSNRTLSTILLPSELR